MLEILSKLLFAVFLRIDMQIVCVIDNCATNRRREMEQRLLRCYPDIPPSQLEI